MKALTLHQPWASLIALGPKTVETRSWSAPAWVIGARIAIHAGKHRVRISNEFDPAMYHAMVQIHGPDWQNHLPLGAVVATAKLAGCFRVVGWNEDRQLKLEGTSAGGENIILTPSGTSSRGDGYGCWRKSKGWTLPYPPKETGCCGTGSRQKPRRAGRKRL